MTADQWHDAWVAALDTLELDVATAEALLADDQRLRDRPLANPWHPPVGLGPLPLDLRPRADAILTRQLAVGEELARTLATNRRQAALLGKLEGGTDTRRPAYVDAIG